MRDAFDYIVMLILVAIILGLGAWASGYYAAMLACEAKGGVYINYYCLNIERL